MSFAGEGSEERPSPDSAEPSPGATAAGWSGELAEALATHSVVLESVIGTGGSAIVYRGHDRKHDRPVAVKVFASDLTDQVGIERFLQEVRVAARLRHPHILPLLDSGRTRAGEVYYLMPLAEGQTLRARLAQGPLPLRQALLVARELAEALAHAHAEGFVHRDVKPENILLESGHAMLADFGLARRVTRADGSVAGPRTRVGMVVGTPSYMSPEQLEAGAPLDGRSDVYSLGVTLYEMLTGTGPFEAENTVAGFARRFQASRPRAGTLREEIPPELDALVEQALEPDPSRRLESASAFAVALEDIERNALPRRRVRPRWSRVALGVLALASLGAIAIVGPRLVRDQAVVLDPRRVVVADMANESADSSLSHLGQLAGDVIASGLTAVPGLEVLNAEYILGAPRQNIVDDVAGTAPDRLRILVDSTHAGTVVSGSFYGSRNRVDFFAEVTNTVTGELVRAVGPITGSYDRPELALEAVRDSVVRIVRDLVEAGERSKHPTPNRSDTP